LARKHATTRITALCRLPCAPLCCLILLHCCFAHYVISRAGAASPYSHVAPLLLFIAAARMRASRGYTGFVATVTPCQRVSRPALLLCLRVAPLFTTSSSTLCARLRVPARARTALSRCLVPCRLACCTPSSPPHHGAS